MAQTIQIRRGTKAELDAITLAIGEIGYTTDTDEVYVGDGSGNHYLIGRALVDAWTNRPAAGVSGRIFYVSSGTNVGYTYLDDGATWQQVGAVNLTDLSGDLDDIDDGTTYGRVLNTYLDTNRPDALWTGSTKLSGSTIAAHINDADKHREINDSASGTTDLWSANKISSEINAVATGLDFQADVFDIVADANTTAPPTSATGDRYILQSNTATLDAGWGTITGVEDNDIVEYSGTAWTVAYDVSVQGEGALVWDRDSNTWNNWTGAEWTEFGGLAGVNAGHGINKVTDTIHVDPSDFTGNGLTTSGTENVDEAISVLADSTGGANLATVINVSSNGVAVNIDDSTIKENGTNQLYIPIDDDTIQISGGVLVATTTQAMSAAGGDGLSWDAVGSEFDVNVGNGLQISTDNVALKLYATEVTAVGDADVNNNPLYLDGTNGLNVKIDSSSVILDSGNGYRLTVGTVDGGTFA